MQQGDNREQRRKLGHLFRNFRGTNVLSGRVSRGMMAQGRTEGGKTNPQPPAASTPAATLDSKNVLWGTAAAGVIGAATAYALEVQKKRKEEERRMTEDASRLNAAARERERLEQATLAALKEVKILDAEVHGQEAWQALDGDHPGTKWPERPTTIEELEKLDPTWVREQHEEKLAEIVESRRKILEDIARLEKMDPTYQIEEAQRRGIFVDSANPPFDKIVDSSKVIYHWLVGKRFVIGDGDGNAIHPNDVDQGNIGDCYFLASLAEIAMQKPDIIQNMISDNGDGTYNVVFYQKGLFGGYTPIIETVTSEFPVNMDGVPVFARFADRNELWVMLLEKAWAQYHGGYNHIVGDWANKTMETLTGVDSRVYKPSRVDIGTLATHFEQNHAVTASTLSDLAITWNLDLKIYPRIYPNPLLRSWQFLNLLKVTVDSARPNVTLNILDIVEISSKTAEIQPGEWHIQSVKIELINSTDRNIWFKINHHGGTLYPGHEYYITNINLENNTITLRNPHGWDRGEIVMPFDEFQEVFLKISVNPLTP